MASEALAPIILEALGLDKDYPAFRILVDLQPNQPIKVYLGLIGSSEMLDIVWPLDGIDIKTLEKPQSVQTRNECCDDNEAWIHNQSPEQEDLIDGT